MYNPSFDLNEERDATPTHVAYGHNNNSAVNEKKAGDGGKDVDGKNANDYRGYRDSTLSGASTLDSSGCGWLCCTPEWLNRFNTAGVATIMMATLAFLQGFIINGITPINTDNFEERFELSSKSSGLINTAYEMSAAIFSLIIPYIGDRHHKPRIVSFACLCYVLGCLLMMAPHFTYSPAYSLIERNVTCVGVDDVHNTTLFVQPRRNGDEQRNFHALFWGMFLNGIGGAVVYTVGIAWLEEGVTTDKSGLYVGIVYFCAAIGVAAGFLVGNSVFQTMWVNLDVNLPEFITPAHKMWVGAWWMPYIIFAILFFIMAVLFWSFPRHLPAVKHVKETRICETHVQSLPNCIERANVDKYSKDNRRQRRRELAIAQADSNFTIESKQGKTMKKVSSVGRNLIKLYFGRVLRLLINPPFIFVCLATTTYGLQIEGLNVFLAKLFENLFLMSSEKTGLFSGGIIILGVAGGLIVSGVVLKIWDPSVRSQLALCSAMFFIHLVTGLGFQLYCNGSPALDDDGSFMQTCSVKTWVYSAISVISMFCGFLTAVPVAIITMRVVHESQRAFALGLQSLLSRALGSVPGPVLLGVILDGACVALMTDDDADCQQAVYVGTGSNGTMPTTTVMLASDSSVHDNAGACRTYDIDRLANNLTIYIIMFRLATLIFMLLALLTYRPPDGASLKQYFSSISLKPSKSTNTLPASDVEGDEET